MDGRNSFNKLVKNIILFSIFQYLIVISGFIYIAKSAAILPIFIYSIASIALFVALVFFIKKSVYKNEDSSLENNKNEIYQQYFYDVIDSLQDNGHVLGYFAPINKEESELLISSELASLLGIKDLREYGAQISYKKWREILDNLKGESKNVPKDTLQTICRVFGEEEKFIRFIYTKNEKVGYVIDVSEEILREKAKQFEKQNDKMTGLLNRESFRNRIKIMQGMEQNAIGAMVCIGLDNLKYINNTYGHTAGDNYIIGAAKLFEKIQSARCLVGRVSGDEFIVYIQGFEDIFECRTKVHEIFNELMNRTMFIMPEKKNKIRFTAGIAYFPENGDDTYSLYKYANFAMGEAKRLKKGTIFDFCKESYLKNSYQMEKREDINKLIEENLVKYAFQPIIDTRDYSIYGYEALMRPQMEGLDSPLEVLELAKIQSKLYYIEKMTIYNIMKWLFNNQSMVKGRKIFMNSIPNQSMTKEDEEYLLDLYGDLFEAVVIEMTEGEVADEIVFNKKINVIKNEFKCKVAIDDFGAGFSNELRIMNIVPEVVKIDKGLIRNIDSDADKQLMVSNFVSYCKQRNILVLAEGVETKEEFIKVQDMGIELVQGFYVGCPEFELMQNVPEHVLECCV